MIGETLWGAPPWLIILVVTLLLMGSHEVGVQSGAGRHRGPKREWGDELG